MLTDLAVVPREGSLAGAGVASGGGGGEGARASVLTGPGSAVVHGTGILCNTRSGDLGILHRLYCTREHLTELSLMIGDYFQPGLD
jgi:hypothetical protein